MGQSNMCASVFGDPCLINVHNSHVIGVCHSGRIRNSGRSGRLRVRSGTSNGTENVLRLIEEEEAREQLARIDAIARDIQDKEI